MATETQTYNGWKNYETWAVKLWLDNDEPTYRYIRRLIREIRVSRPAVYWLADHLFEVVACNAPDLGASMYTYLLHAALDDVDWREIAESFLVESAAQAAPADEPPLYQEGDRIFYWRPNEEQRVRHTLLHGKGRAGARGSIRPSGP